MAHAHSHDAPTGFTLIELSIVLVIIGLIVGGVLLGQDLIRAAGERSTLAQIEKFNVATATFYGKYGGLPGDLAITPAAQFGFAPRGMYKGEGDGNGVLEGVTSNSTLNNWGFTESAGETVMFWSDLSYANGMNLNMIEGRFSAATETVPTVLSNTQLAQYFPQAKTGNGGYIYAWNNNRASGSGNSQNYFGLSAFTSVQNGPCGYCPYSDPTNIGLSVRQASDLDRKIDDGVPTTGRVLATYVDGTAFSGTGNGYAPNAAIPTNSTCFDTTSNSYSVTQNSGAGPNCALSFKFQAGY